MYEYQEKFCYIFKLNINNTKLNLKKRLKIKVDKCFIFSLKEVKLFEKMFQA